MAKFEQDVEVVSVGHALAASDGSPLYQIAFGRIGPTVVPVAQGPQGPISLPPNAQVAVIWTTLFVPTTAGILYPVGSSWKLIVDEDGTFEVRKRESARPTRRGRKPKKSR